MILTSSRTAVILMGVSAQIVLTALFIWRIEPRIEDSLTDQSQRVLRDAGIAWARVEADGRDLTLSGMAPDNVLAEQAVGLVQDVDGVRVVKSKVLISPPRDTVVNSAENERRARELLADIEDTAPIFAIDLPYELHFQIEASVLTLSGLVPDEVAKESLLNLANRTYGDGRLIDRLLTSPGAPDGYLSVASRAISIAPYLTEGFIAVTDKEIIVQGITIDSASQERIAADLEQNLPDHYRSQVQTGDQGSLAQILRTYPELADRVGVFNTSTNPVATDTRSNTVQQAETDTNQQIAQQSSRSECQKQFDAAIAKQKIGFRTASSDIDGNSLQVMADLVQIAKQCPGARIEISGHTDDQGTEQNNYNLSQRRAESVMEYMVRNGVSLGRLTAVGYGEGQPLVENTTAERREINRRIEFRITDEN